MCKHLPKIILLTIYPCFLWAGSAFLDTVPDTREGFGKVAQRFSKLTDAANAYDFMRGTAFRGELSTEMTTESAILNGYLNYLAVAYAGAAEGSITEYIVAITSAAKESKASMLAIKLPEVVGNDFKIAQYLRWVIGSTLIGSTFQEVSGDIKRKLSFPFPGVTAQAHDLWAAILVSACKPLGLKVTSRSPVAISISFSRDTLPIIHAYNPALAEAARRKAAAAESAAAASGGSARSVWAVSSTEASTAISGVSTALAGPAEASESTLRRRGPAAERVSGQESAESFSDSAAVALISTQDPPAPRCKVCTML